MLKTRYYRVIIGLLYIGAYGSGLTPVSVIDIYIYCSRYGIFNCS